MIIAPKHKKILKFIRRMTKLVNDALEIRAHRAHIAGATMVSLHCCLLFFFIAVAVAPKTIPTGGCADVWCFCENDIFSV